MRKVLPILLAIAIAAPALADVTITASDATGGVLQIDYAITGDSVVRGIALALSDAGLPSAPESEVAAVTDLTVVQLSDGTGLSWAYIDYYFSNTGFLGGLTDETELPGTGAHALADVDAAGVAVPPASAYSVSLGVLDNTAAQDGLTGSGTLCTIQLSEIIANSDHIATIAIVEDALRGGIVGDDLGTVTVEASQDIEFVSECFSDALGNYAEWVQFGSPSCWCYEYNCRGDADGKTEGTTKTGIKHVYLLDLGILSSAYNVAEPTKGPGIDTIPNGICADFDRAPEGTTKTGIKRVYLLDLGILSSAYNVSEPTKGPGIAICPLVGAGGEINFYTYAP